MKRNQWIILVVVAVVFAGGGFLIGKNQASASTAGSAGASGFTRGAGGAAAFAGRSGFGGASGGGATIGTVLSVGSGTFTVQLPNSTSTTATTGTKIVLLDDATQITELETVSPSSLQVGQGVTVAGSANSDGSVTASSVMIRPASANAGAHGSGQ